MLRMCLFFVFFIHLVFVGSTLTSMNSECQSQNKSEIRNMIHSDDNRNICEQTEASVSYLYAYTINMFFMFSIFL